MSSSSKNPLKRLGFKRQNTGDGPIETTTELNEFDRDDLGEGPSGAGQPAVSKIDAEFAGQVGKSSHQNAIRDLSETEANRRLSAFRAEHSFDPNLPDSAFDAIGDVTRAHDQKGEAILVDELIEDSPYPEVS